MRPARYVIHTVGPLQPTSKKSEELLASCYRRCLQIADELGIKTIAFPVIGVGSYGWPGNKAIPIEARTLMGTPSDVGEIRVITSTDDIRLGVDRWLAEKTWLRLLQGVRVLHERGYEGVRVFPGLSPSNVFWRLGITLSKYFEPRKDDYGPKHDAPLLTYGNAAGSQFGRYRVISNTPPEAVATMLLDQMPELATRHSDPEYVVWYRALCLRFVRAWIPCRRHTAIPMSRRGVGTSAARSSFPTHRHRRGDGSASDGCAAVDGPAWAKGLPQAPASSVPQIAPRRRHRLSDGPQAVRRVRGWIAAQRQSGHTPRHRNRPCDGPARIAGHNVRAPSAVDSCPGPASCVAR